jgi:hypothetical protein
MGGDEVEQARRIGVTMAEGLRGYRLDDRDASAAKARTSVATRG